MLTHEIKLFHIGPAHIEYIEMSQNEISGQ